MFRNLKKLRIYHIVVKRPSEGDYIFHKAFLHAATEDDILQAVLAEDCGYDIKHHGRIDYRELV